MEYGELEEWCRLKYGDEEKFSKKYYQMSKIRCEVIYQLYPFYKYWYVHSAFSERIHKELLLVIDSIEREIGLEMEN